MKNKHTIFLCFCAAFFLFSGTSCFSAETKTETSKRLALINTALKYLGTPYRYTGTTAKGMDCSGFVYRSILDTFGTKVPRRSDALAVYTEKIRDEDIQPGDLLFFKTTNRISHVGIYLGAGLFIHSASDGPQTGVIISGLHETYWRKHYVLAGRINPAETLFSGEAAGMHIMLRNKKNCRIHPAIKEFTL